MLTDYSSNAFEMAYIERPVVYFQFDRTAFFAGGHVYRQGTWSYDDDGFGPVAVTASSAIDEVERLIADGLRPRPRLPNGCEHEFPFRDGQSCERVYQAIDDITQPLTDDELPPAGRVTLAARDHVRTPRRPASSARHARRRAAERLCRSSVAVFETSPEPGFGDQPRTIAAMRARESARDGRLRPDPRSSGLVSLRSWPCRPGGPSGRAPPAPATRTACRRRRARESPRRPARDPRTPRRTSAGVRATGIRPSRNTACQTAAATPGVCGWR